MFLTVIVALVQNLSNCPENADVGRKFGLANTLLVRFNEYLAALVKCSCVKSERDLRYFLQRGLQIRNSFIKGEYNIRTELIYTDREEIDTLLPIIIRRNTIKGKVKVNGFM